MQTFTIYTLVDITETGQYGRGAGTELEKQQQQNFLTLTQTIGLRVNPIYDRKPKRIEDFDMKSQPFGSKFKGQHTVWKWDFYIEYDGGFKTDVSEYGLLEQDLHFIPIITDLTETAKFSRPVFDTQTDQDRNTVISVANDK